LERRRRPLTPIRERDDDLPGATPWLGVNREEFADEIQATDPPGPPGPGSDAEAERAADNQVTRPGQSA
jgi:hypothetical protein